MIDNKFFDGIKKIILELSIKFKYELVLFGSICIVFIANSLLNQWLFWDSPNGLFIDKWIYEGYSLYYKDFINYFGSTYYSGRLPWIIPGYTLHALFSPLIARYILHFVFFILAVFSLFLIIKNILNEKSAFVASLLLIFYPVFLQTMGTDYPVPALITYLLLTLLMLLYAAKHQSWKFFLIFAGFFCGMMFFSQMFSIIFIPSIIIFYVILNKQKNRNSYRDSLLFFVIGGIIATFLLMLFSFIISGHLDFISGQLSNLIYYSNVKTNYDYPIFEWLPASAYLILPLTIFIGSIIIIVKNHSKLRQKNFEPVIFLNINYFVLFLLFIFLQFKPNSNPVLEYWYYTSDLIPFAFLSFSTFIMIFIESLKKKTMFLLSAIIIIFSIFSLSSSNFWYISREFSQNIWIYYSMCIIPIVTWIVFFLYAIYSQNQKIIKNLFFICVIITTIFLYPISAYPIPFEKPNVDEKYYGIIIETSDIIHQKIPDGEMRFWYNASERYGGLFNSINSIYLWGYTWIGRDFPDIPKENIEKMLNTNKEMKVIILSEDDNAVKAAQETLHKYGYDATILDSGQVFRGDIKINYFIIQINDKNEEIINKQILDLNNSVQIYSQANNNFINSLQRNIYGPHGKDEVIRQENGTYIFNPTSDKDHLASPFFPIPADNSSETYLVIGIQPSVGDKQMTYSNASIVLQDENYSIISGNLFVPSHDTTPKPVWQIENVIHIPQNTREVRLYITSSDGHSAVLPAKIEMYKVIINDPKLLKPSGSGSAL